MTVTRRVYRSGESEYLINGGVTAPDRRTNAYLGKLGYDKQLTSDLRVRLTGSAFTQNRSANQTLFAGDRAGSRYYSVVESNTDEKAAFTSGAINPGVNSIHAYVINPFVKVGGLAAGARVNLERPLRADARLVDSFHARPEHVLARARDRRAHAPRRPLRDRARARRDRVSLRRARR